MITVEMLHSVDDNDLKRVFCWLTKSGMGPAFGSRPIGWYQLHQCAAMDVLADKLTPYVPSPTDCLSVCTEQFDNKYVYLVPCNKEGRQIGDAKRIVSASDVYRLADDKCRK